MFKTFVISSDAWLLTFGSRTAAGFLLTKWDETQETMSREQSWWRYMIPFAAPTAILYRFSQSSSGCPALNSRRIAS
uniref:Uncharacterized protein n=1 Tax=Leersia perrieri TaxID=77586 RepID=A0A0D9V8J1_9ORYZ